jgi:nucleoside-triphosphate--adenylate kinase
VSRRLENYHMLNDGLLRYYAAQDKLRGDGDQLLHTLAGRTSDEIWPQLRDLVTRRFGRIGRRAEQG